MLVILGIMLAALSAQASNETICVAKNDRIKLAYNSANLHGMLEGKVVGISDNHIMVDYSIPFMQRYATIKIDEINAIAKYGTEWCMWMGAGAFFTMLIAAAAIGDAAQHAAQAVNTAMLVVPPMMHAMENRKYPYPCREVENGYHFVGNDDNLCFYLK